MCLHIYLSSPLGWHQKALTRCTLLALDFLGPINGSRKFLLFTSSSCSPWSIRATHKSSGQGKAGSVFTGALTGIQMTLKVQFLSQGESLWCRNVPAGVSQVAFESEVRRRNIINAFLFLTMSSSWPLLNLPITFCSCIIFRKRQRIPMAWLLKGQHPLIWFLCSGKCFCDLSLAIRI